MGGWMLFRWGVEWCRLGMTSLGRYRVCKAIEEINITYLTLLSLSELFNRDAMLSIAVSLIFFDFFLGGGSTALWA